MKHASDRVEAAREVGDYGLSRFLIGLNEFERFFLLDKLIRIGYMFPNDVRRRLNVERI